MTSEIKQLKVKLQCPDNAIGDIILKSSTKIGKNSAEPVQKDEMIDAISTKRYLRNKLYGNIGADDEAFELEWLCWCIGGDIVPHINKTLKAEYKHGYIGCSFSKNEIEKFKPCSSRRLISLKNLKQRPLWREESFKDIHNLLLSYRDRNMPDLGAQEKDKKNNKMSRPGENKLDIFQRPEVIDSDVIKIILVSPFNDIVLDTEQCNRFYANMHPLQKSNSNDLERGEYYFVLSQIEAIEAELLLSKIYVIDRLHEAQKYSYASVLKTLIDAVVKAIAEGKLVYKEQRDCVNLFYTLGKGCWDLIPERKNKNACKNREQIIKVNIKRTLGLKDIDFWTKVEPYKKSF